MLELRAGRIDIAATMLRSAQRDEEATFLPYAYTVNYLISPKREGRHYASFEQFMLQSGAHLDVVRGLLQSPTVLANQAFLSSQGRLGAVSDFATLFRKMAAGRVDATVVSPWVYLWYARAAGIESQLDVLPLPEFPAIRLGMYMSNALEAANWLCCTNARGAPESRLG